MQYIDHLPGNAVTFGGAGVVVLSARVVVVLSARRVRGICNSLFSLWIKYTKYSSPQKFARVPVFVWQVQKLIIHMPVLHCAVFHRVRATSLPWHVRSMFM